MPVLEVVLDVFLDIVLDVVLKIFFYGGREGGLAPYFMSLLKLGSVKRGYYVIWHL